MGEKYTTQTATIQAFGLVLKALHYEDLPSLLQGRNREDVRNAMPIENEVSYRSLYFWYKKQEHSLRTYSYLAYANQTPIAFTALTDIDYRARRAEGGLFVFDDQYQATGMAYHIILCREIIMDYLKIETLISRIRRENNRSIKFCESYGSKFVRCEGNMLIYASERNVRRRALKRIATLAKLEQDFQTYLEGGEKICY